MFNNFFSRAFMSSLCSLSLATVTLFGQNAEGTYVEEEPGYFGSGGKTALIIGGAAVAGAVGGVIAAQCSKGHGHRHHHNSGSGIPGPQGPQGPVGGTGGGGPVGPAGAPGPSFTPDIGETLTFTLDADVVNTNGGDVAAADISFYVTQPNGTTVFSANSPILESYLANELKVAIATPAIVITDPVFGEYMVGVNVLNSSPVSSNLSVVAPSGSTLNGFRVVSSNGIETVLTPSPTTAITILPTDQAQINATFIYAPILVP